LPDSTERVLFDVRISNAVVNLAAALQNQAKRDESIKYYKEKDPQVIEILKKAATKKN
jgi:hypothetical protein